MDIFEWKKRLADTFHTNGIVGASLSPILEAEKAFGVAAANTYHGYFYLSSSFQSFLLDTLFVSESASGRLSTDPPFTWYRPVLLSYVGVFRVCRAAETLFTSGYPLNGYGLLRDLKDRALAYGAILNGITSFKSANGWDAVEVEPGQFTYEHFRKARDARKNQDSRILKNMIGSQSGLGNQVSEQLFRWNDLFHTEVHGGRLTFALEGAPWLVGKSNLPVAPNLGDLTKSIGMFANRYEEVVALLVRVLPYLQLSSEPFDQAWREKWTVLNDYLGAVFDFHEQKEREITTEFKTLLRVKFGFNPESTFYRE